MWWYSTFYFTCCSLPIVARGIGVGPFNKKIKKCKFTLSLHFWKVHFAALREFSLARKWRKSLLNESANIENQFFILFDNLCKWSIKISCNSHYTTSRKTPVGKHFYKGRQQLNKELTSPLDVQKTCAGNGHAFWNKIVFYCRESLYDISAFSAYV